MQGFVLKDSTTESHLLRKLTEAHLYHLDRVTSTLTFSSCQVWSLLVMQSCSSALWILILLISTFTAALNTTVQIKPGEPLLLDLDVAEEVEVIYNSTASDGAAHAIMAKRNTEEKRDTGDQTEGDRGAAGPAWSFTLMMAALVAVIEGSVV
ncbi:hypothetical protein MHYP_G00263310 [Metynnis hypsauchen]